MTLFGIAQIGDPHGAEPGETNQYHRYIDCNDVAGLLECSTIHPVLPGIASEDETQHTSCYHAGRVEGAELHPEWEFWEERLTTEGPCYD